MNNDDINIDELAALARIEMDVDEKQSVKDKIVSILDYVKQVQEVELGDEEENLGSVYNIFREDNSAFEAGAFTADIMDQAPDTETTPDGIYLKVKKIL